MIYCTTQASAINVLQENATLRGQLSQLSSKQKTENRKNILYYRGLSSYSGIDRASSSYYNSDLPQSDIYVKKGVKFKVDVQKQEQKLKEIQEQEKTEIKTVATVEEKPKEENSKIEENTTQPSQKSSHNTDAE